MSSLEQQMNYKVDFMLWWHGSVVRYNSKYTFWDISVVHDVPAQWHPCIIAFYSCLDEREHASCTCRSQPAILFVNNATVWSYYVVGVHFRILRVALTNSISHSWLCDLWPISLSVFARVCSSICLFQLARERLGRGVSACCLYTSNNTKVIAERRIRVWASGQCSEQLHSRHLIW